MPYEISGVKVNLSREWRCRLVAAALDSGKFPRDRKQLSVAIDAAGILSVSLSGAGVRPGLQCRASPNRRARR